MSAISQPIPKVPTATPPRANNIESRLLNTLSKVFLMGAMGGGSVAATLGLLRKLVPPEEDPEDSRLLSDEMAINLVNPESMRRKSAGETGWYETIMGTPRSLSEHPLFYPGALAALGGGAYLGHKGIKSILAYLRKKELEEQKEQARQEFETAIRGQFSAFNKESAKKNLSAHIDNLYDQLEKNAQGNWTKFVTDLGGLSRTTLGLGLGLAALLAYLGHRKAYGELTKENPAAINRELLRRAAIESYRESPPPVIFDYPKNRQETEESVERMGM